MNKALLESQEGVLYFITLALSDIFTLSSAASQSAHNSQTLQGFLSPLYLKELEYEVSSPIPLHCDNKGAVDLSQNPITGRCFKHITIKHHAIREYAAKQAIELVHTPTGEMLADGLTKSLPRASFDNLVNGLGFTA